MRDFLSRLIFEMRRRRVASRYCCFSIGWNAENRKKGIEDSTRRAQKITRRTQNIQSYCGSSATAARPLRPPR
jgi:hypothetical protein